jgi:hypothetical protein
LRGLLSLAAPFSLAALLTLSLAGCVIGPKPDEPGITGAADHDAGTTADTSSNAGDDSGVLVTPSDAAVDTGDLKNDGCGDAADGATGDGAAHCGDAAPDAASDADADASAADAAADASDAPSTPDATTAD